MRFDGDYGPRYYALNGRPLNMWEWARAIEHYRHIGDVYLRIRGRIYRVSTVWLGLDHGWSRYRPLIFETMVFLCGSDSPSVFDQRPVIFNDLIARYSTLTEAQRGHRMMVRAVKRIAREQPRHPQLIHNGRKPIGRRSTICRRK